MPLREVIEDVRAEIASAAGGVTAADARAAFVSPILQELGWFGLRRIRFDYRVEQGQLSWDCALLGTQDRPAAVIEVRAPGGTMDAEADRMVANAARAGVGMCSLTNGALWRLYLPDQQGASDGGCFASLDLQADQIDSLAEVFESCLGYDALIDDSALTRADELLLKQRSERRLREAIPRVWEALLSQPDDLLVELVQEAVEQDAGDRPNAEHVRAFLMDSASSASRSASVAEAAAISDAQRERVPALPSGSRPQAGTLRQVPQEDESPVPRRSSDISSSWTQQPKKPRRKRPAKLVSGFRLWGTFHQAQNQGDVLRQVSELVYEKHSDSFERVLGMGNFSDDPTRMIRPHQINHSRYYVDLNNAYERMKRTCEMLLEKFGYSADDLEIVEIGRDTALPTPPRKPRRPTKPRSF